MVLVGNKAPSRGVVQIEARQHALVYITRRREDKDDVDIIATTFLFKIFHILL